MLAIPPTTCTAAQEDLLRENEFLKDPVHLSVS